MNNFHEGDPQAARGIRGLYPIYSSLFTQESPPNYQPLCLIFFICRQDMITPMIIGMRNAAMQTNE